MRTLMRFYFIVIWIQVLHAKGPQALTDMRLHRAVHAGNTKEVRAALEAGARLDVSDRYGKTALMAAAENGHVAIVHFLLNRGSKVNGRNAKDQTAHDVINLKDKNGDTALMYAVRADQADIVQLLL